MWCIENDAEFSIFDAIEAIQLEGIDFGFPALIVPHQFM